MEATTDLVSRADIARLLGIARPTVTIWERRYPGYPASVTVDGRDMFSLSALAAWLADRVIPADSRGPDESPGTTYGDRLRRNLGHGPRAVPPVREQARRLVGELAPLADRLPSRTMYLDLVLTLLMIRCRYPDQWSRLRDMTRSGASEESRDAMRQALEVSRLAYGEPHSRWWEELAETERFPETATVVRVLDGVRPAPDEPGGALAPVLFDLLVSDFVGREGSRAADYATPESIVRLMTNLLPPIPRGARIHDPNCRTGDLLASVYHRMSSGSPGMPAVVTGRDRDPRKCRISRMRLALLGAQAEVTCGPEYGLREPPPSQSLYDVVLTNPPFNSWGPVQRHHDDFRWPFGKPPASANFAWLQYAVYLLREGGRAMLLMTNNASFSSQAQEQHIRRGMIERGAVECVIALPSHLFPGSAIAPTIWLLRHPTGRDDDILFIDARTLGRLRSRGRRELSTEDTDEIANLYRAWRAGPTKNASPAMVEGISRSASIAQIRSRDFSLNPAAYVDGPPTSVPAARSREGVRALTVELDNLQSEAARIDAKANELMRRLGLWTR